MVSDTEPRYRLVDSNGNVVGSLFAEADGTLKIQEGTSGSDNEVSLGTDGTVTAPAVSTGDLTVNSVPYLAKPFSGVGDDTAVTVDVNGFEIIDVSTSFSGVNGTFYTGFDDIYNSTSGRNITDQGNSTLSGTTGTDGSLNVSRSDNTLYLENRLGDSRDITVLSFRRNPP